MTRPLTREARELVFVESDCKIGGDNCCAWSEWFWASVEADPTSTDDERDPLPLTNYPFDPEKCGLPEQCPLARAQ